MKECKVCNYLNQLISNNVSYQELEQECDKRPIPASKFFILHKETCLKNITFKDTNIISDSNSEFSFKNFDKDEIKIRANNLKKEWFLLCEKLTQIVAFNIDKYNPQKTTTSERIKETVFNLKILIDLTKTNFDLSQLEEETTNVYEFCTDEEIIQMKNILDKAQKRQLEHNKK